MYQKLAFTYILVIYGLRFILARIKKAVRTLEQHEGLFKGK
ncbi:hypothetical protein Bsph_0787 [Lysinibacillus sphaericus C3-41]|uniref:Uncharacterized protein n=1 Tax=Lysinibacillus sphaericus (strain C3-41) TaxID=444177 RepID=B1HZ03_LYSSC|nr:hypothetical protein Bsph_0787 [Lysinibacillus sphaericus C3-41]